MKPMLKILLAAVALAASGSSVAQERKDPIKFALLEDFTRVYTFVTQEYNQGQRDYLALVNANGGIDGHPVEVIVRDTGNEPQRGIEAFNRAISEGAVLVDFLSTPVSRANVQRAMQNKVVMITPLHGRGDAADGKTFPYIFPLFATYWSQASLLLKYIEDHEGGLKGKKIAFVHIDSPFGREPIPILDALKAGKGFTYKTFAYPSPGNEQSSTWSEVRRMRPDHVIIWGAGGGQPVSVREAARNGIPASKILSVVWMAESDVRTVGPQVAKGVKRYEAVAPGKDHQVIRQIVAKVVNPGKSAGDAKNVGSSYYNVGVANMAVAVEGARLALEKFGAPLTGDKLRQGLELIKDYDAQGLMPPVTYSAKDHQGGGYGRVSQWTGSEWKPLTDWMTAYQDLVWQEIEQGAAQYRKGD